MKQALNSRDWDTLKLFAYHRLIVGHYQEAGLLYQYLSLSYPDEMKWALGEALCLIRQARHDEARDALARVRLDACDDKAKALTARLAQCVQARASLPPRSPTTPPGKDEAS